MRMALPMVIDTAIAAKRMEAIEQSKAEVEMEFYLTAIMKLRETH